jgi:hypothetical protein
MKRTSKHSKRALVSRYQLLRRVVAAAADLQHIQDLFSETHHCYDTAGCLCCQLSLPHLLDSLWLLTAVFTCLAPHHMFTAVAGTCLTGSGSMPE